PRRVALEKNCADVRGIHEIANDLRDRRFSPSAIGTQPWRSWRGGAAWLAPVPKFQENLHVTNNVAAIGDSRLNETLQSCHYQSTRRERSFLFALTKRAARISY